MKELPQNYEAALVEKKWQDKWEADKIYAWDSEASREDSFVIDTPPPTISGQLHMGHIFSYTQTDFIARYKRMQGFNIFYPMGFDDNGLPTERLVEKEKKKKAYQYPSREEFIKECEGVAEKYRGQFRNLFKSIALSVDWAQEYHTISDEVMKISQMSFIDLYNKGLVERKLEPMFWDPVDQTAIAQAEIEEKELDSFENYIWFGLRVKSGEHKGKFVKIRKQADSSLRGEEADAAIHATNEQASQPDGLLRPLGARNDEWVVEYVTQSDPEWFKGIEVMTTRPELLPACVAFMYHPEDARAELLKNCEAISPLFQAIVPTIADEAVQKDKGTGVVMCCTFGDEQDVRWWKQKYSELSGDKKLSIRVIINKHGKIDKTLSGFKNYIDDFRYEVSGGGVSNLWKSLDANQAQKLLEDSLDGLKTFQTSKENIPPARLKVIELLEENNFTAKEKKKVTHPVKCAERSGCSLEIIPTQQWFVKILEFKEQLKQKALECNWNPDFMKVRILQWIDSLSWDWCISRQRYFGVPFPVWFIKDISAEKTDSLEILIPNINQLPVNPLSDLPNEYMGISSKIAGKFTSSDLHKYSNEKNIIVHAIHIATGKEYRIGCETDVMDTWATSSISPQINSKGINLISSLRGGEADAAIHSNGQPSQSDGLLRSSARNDGTLAIDVDRHKKLFPADLRPQAHEIIRTWAFYTIVKAMHHENTIPWKNLMISGWCLAEDKTKMSKSKGNVVTPESVLVENSADVIRYWASTSKLGADTAFSKETLKIGKKLTNKLWNATKFASIHLSLVTEPKTAAQNLASGIIFEATDKAIISKLRQVVLKATEEFECFEYSVARSVVEEFFWKDFCDNYLEIIKTRIYNEDAANHKSRLSAAYAVYHCLETLLRLFAPFLPHITEELYQAIFEPKNSIHTQNTWANVDDYFYDEQSIKENDALVLVLEFVRKYKAEKNISIKFPIEKISINCDAEFQSKIEKIKTDLQNVISAKELVFADITDENFSETEDKKVKIKLEILETNG